MKLLLIPIFHAGGRRPLSAVSLNSDHWDLWVNSAFLSLVMMAPYIAAFMN